MSDTTDDLDWYDGDDVIYDDQIEEYSPNRFRINPVSFFKEITMDTVEYTVNVSKTVQVRQYEPVNIQLSCKGTCPRNQLSSEYDKAFTEIKTKINELFDGKPKNETFLD